ncbi:glycosyltransferase [Mesorhizobium sp. AaZ16]|uniref:CgeB family protein n=1 Tax=Mesorhizobium sp. AaZ16 TaxID=3402289 RepID=UPI00374F85CD
MKIAIFGLTVSSSWGNGHATLWRGLIRALTRRGWSVTFFERDVPYYAGARDLYEIDGGGLIFYGDWAEVRDRAEREIAGADVAVVTSYCPDAIAATGLVLDAPSALRVFYDLDTPVTLLHLKQGGRPDYVGAGGLAGFDLVLSYTGGSTLAELGSALGARRTAALYGHVDPDQYGPAASDPDFSGDLSYLGTYAADRQESVERLLIEAARLRPDRRFVIGGAQYPEDFPWTENIHFVRHLPPPDHPAFYASSRLTLNVTRQAMASMGWCPSGRLFEAAACGSAIVTDVWPGLENFFEPGGEIITVRDTQDVVAALDLPNAELERIGRNARERVLRDHTSDRRAQELEAILAEAFAARRSPMSFSEVA